MADCLGRSKYLPMQSWRPVRARRKSIIRIFEYKKETGDSTLYTRQLDSGSNEGLAPFSSSLSATSGKSVNT
ncbi:MAG: hypothetical protein WC762_07805 [Methylobacter sp.]|jgi:hypothetical protein